MGHRESDVTEHTHDTQTHTHRHTQTCTHTHRNEVDQPDRVTWQATVRGVARSQTLIEHAHRQTHRHIQTCTHTHTGMRWINQTE